MVAPRVQVNVKLGWKFSWGRGIFENTTSQIEKTLSLFEILLPDSLRKSHFFLYFPQGFVGKIAGFFCVGLDDPIQIIHIFLKPRHLVLQRLQH